MIISQQYSREDVTCQRARLKQSQTCGAADRCEVARALTSSALAVGLFDSEAAHFEFYYEGTYDDLYIARGKSETLLARVRIRSDVSSGGGLIQQHEFMRQIPFGIGPDPKYIDCSCNIAPFQFRIEEFVPGKTPARIDAHLTIRLARMLASLHRYLDVRDLSTDHPLLDPGMRALLEPDPTREARIEALAAFALAALCKLVLDFPRTARCLTHGDIHLGNMRDDGVRCALVDWEHVAVADPALDIATLFWFSALMGLEEMPLEVSMRALFFEHYVELTGDDSIVDRVRLYEVVVVALQLASWYEKVQRGADTAEHGSIEAEIQRSLRIVESYSRTSAFLAALERKEV